MATTGKANGHNDSFIINNIELSIAPTDIHISKDSANYQWQTLRTKSSQKTKSGHSSINIEFTVPFVGIEDINSKLRPLIAQLRYMPFCYVDNLFIRENLFPNEEAVEANEIRSKNTIILAIRAISISVKFDTPDTVWATFQFSYFNYAPYIPYWQYKKDLFGKDSFKYVSNPSVSKAWEKFITPCINETSLYTGDDSSAGIKFVELRTASLSNIQSLEQSKTILKQLQNNPKDFFSTLRSEVFDTPEETLRNAVSKKLPGFSGVDDIGSSEIILPIVLAASPRANPQSTSFDIHGNYVNQETIKQAIAQIDDQIAAKIKATDKVQSIISDGFLPVKELTGKDNRGQGFGVFKRIQGINLNKDQDIVITGITVSIQNILATLPIIGQKYATFQHIGSIDATICFDMKVLSDDAMRNLSWFYDTVNENMLVNRHVPQGLQTIRVQNNFLGLFNLKEFITSDMQVDTVPGNPGTYDVKLCLVESGLKSDSQINDQEQFRVEFSASDPGVIKAVVDAIVPFIKLGNFSGTQKFVSTLTEDKRSERFSQIVSKFVGNGPGNVFGKILSGEVSIRKRLTEAVVNLGKSIGAFKEDTPIENSAIASALNKFASDVSDIVDKQPTFINSLFAIKDNNIPGISKVQEFVFRKIQDNGSRFPILSQDFSNKGLAAVIEEAKKNAITTEKLQKDKARKDLINQLNGSIIEQPQQDKKTSFFDKILSGEIPLQSSTAGTLGTALLNNSSGETILEKSSVEILIAKDPFIKWLEFISNLTASVINSTDIDLPQFSKPKSMIGDLGLNRGLPAYPDFQFERIVSNDVDKLLSLDPDCFLFSQMETSIDDFIDPALIANAKAISNKSYNTAIDQISKYYQDSWLPSAISDNIRDKVISNISAGVVKHGTNDSSTVGDDVNKAYYRGNTKIGDFYNATSQIGHQPIKVGDSQIDPQQIHASTVSALTVKCANPPIMHSLDPGRLTASSASEVFLPSVSTPGTPESNSKGSKFAGGSQLFKPLDGELKIAGSRGGFEDFRTKAKFGADDKERTFVATHGRLHYGVDLIADIGSKIYSVADGTIIRMGWDRRTPKGNAAGFAILIKHQENSQSWYFHMEEPQRKDNIAPDAFNINGTILKTGSKVRGGQLIGTVGRTAVQKDTPSHLHMEFHDQQGRAINPGDYLSITAFNGKKNIAVANYGPKNGPVHGVTAGSAVMDYAISNFYTSLRNGQGMRLARAFPTFKLYFIQDDSGNRRRYGMDDFFSYNSVVEINCVRSRKIPADLLDITLTNVSGILSNRKFHGPRKVDDENPEGIDISNAAIDKVGDVLTQDPNGFLKRDSKFENPLASIMLQPGIDVELRLGYTNDPDKLSTVFVGKIMEVEFSESDDLVRIVCQSHAIELVQDIKGMDKPIVKDGWFINDARTDRILESMMSEPEIIHFGRWVRSSTNNDTNSNRDLLTNKFTLTPTPQDDNIFVPPIDILNQLDNGWFFKNLKYSIFRTTVWDVFDEMTLRHPGWIKSPVPYHSKNGPRMTMFFGLPSQLYFAADPSNKEKQAFAGFVNDYKTTVEKLRNGFILNPELLENNDNYLQAKPKEKDFTEDRIRFAKDFQSIKPFRSYHLLTSKNHIISNNIRASSKGTFNTVSIQYGQGKFNDKTQQLVQEDYDILTLSIDAALPDEDMRELFVQYMNCQHKLMAKKYAVAVLIKQLKEVYRGELIVVGNPDIKPYDICQIFDDYNDIMGPIEVEQVIHRFSQDTGFITEITPDLFVTANEWVNMTASDLMSIIIEGTCSSFTNGAPTFTEGLGSKAPGAIAAGIVGLALLSPLAAIVAGGATVAGYFMLQKMVDFTSHGQPVVLHPLIHRGVPFIAGLPMVKLNNLWTTNKGQWFKEAFEGIGLALEDFNDKLTLAPSQGNIFNLFSGNTVTPKF